MPGPTPVPSAPVTTGDGTGGIIPYKNPSALIAYYLGVFSIIPCFPIGIVAVVLGILGLRARKKNPIIKGSVHAWIGILAGGFFGLAWLAGTVAAIVGIAASGKH